MKNLFFSFIALLFLFVGCSKDSKPTEPSNNEFPAEPTVSMIFPAVAIPNGYIYVHGNNFGQSANKISVKFRSRATRQEKNGIIEAVEATKITVRVPADIDTTSLGNEIVVTTPKGTIVDTSTVVYGVRSSAFGNTLLPGKGLVGKVYQLQSGTSSLPNFNTMPVKSVILAPNLDVPTRSFTEGFPGVPGGLIEWFGIRFVAKLEITTAGNYTFIIGSDDGSKLYINDSLIINNDGLHSYLEKSASINLTAGEHRIRVDYYQGPRTEIALRLFWRKPGTTVNEIIPPSAFNLPDINQIR
ncbi:MAG: PA14 domain-containing protein [Ignavibacteria bacterium]|nr:PA14 domain-containing protein [Ignavibacteria bacterium]